MSDKEIDPYAHYFTAAEASFTAIRDTARWQDPPIAAALTTIRRRVLAGGFPVNMEVEPLDYTSSDP
ncbi:MAG: hypothetical protein PHO20_02810 [Candidatus Peribacteraceae bacterium]|nr:hypothetical protein [Candidatus Peribacteraceae bacterium]MDD5739672.1 hypothetical protein [Candidatus Peribacteraceae bacterium]